MSTTLDTTHPSLIWESGPGVLFECSRNAYERISNCASSDFFRYHDVNLHGYSYLTKDTELSQVPLQYPSFFMGWDSDRAIHHRAFDELGCASGLSMQSSSIMVLHPSLCAKRLVQGHKYWPK